jgi:hypothetical protein
VKRRGRMAAFSPNLRLQDVPTNSQKSGCQFKRPESGHSCFQMRQGGQGPKDGASQKCEASHSLAPAFLSKFAISVFSLVTA